MSARALLKQLLTDHIPGATATPRTVQVLDYASQIDPPPIPTVMPRLDRIRRGQSLGLRTYDFALVLLAARTEPGAGDDQLEALADQVMFALEQVPGTAGGLTWDEAKRATYAGTLPAFELPLSIAVEVTT